MAADPNRTLGHKPLFARFFSTDVMQDAIPAGENCIRNNLFVAGISLRDCTGEEVIVSACEHGIEERLRCEIQTLETAQFIKQTSFDDEYVFVRRIHHFRRKKLRPLVVRSGSGSGLDRSGRHSKDVDTAPRDLVSSDRSPGSRLRPQSEY